MNINFDQRLINKKFRSISTRDTRTQIYFGGAGSSKSFSVFTYSVIWALQGKSILCIRHNDAHITRSIWSEVTKAITRLKLSRFFSINKSDRSISCKISNGCIMFSGIMDSEKIKSATPLQGTAFDTIIVEEASELNESQLNQLYLRQRGTTKFKKTLIMLLNPIFKSHFIYDRFFKQFESDFDLNDLNLHIDTKDLFIERSTYRDNVYLADEDIATIESMKEISPYHYDVYGNGLWGGIS